MNYTLRYTSLRSEVWRWYWKAWMTYLWRIHVFIAAFFCIGFVGFGLKSSNPVIWVKYFFIAAVTITALSSVIPQILFKRQERVLNIGEEGWDTQIGDKKGERRWSEIASVKEDSGNVIITNKNGNALIVPQRAFQSREDMDHFFKHIRNWHLSYKSADK